MTLPQIYHSYPTIAPSIYKGKLANKVVLVTGCSVGLGRAIAKAFAAAGASVAAVARREPDLKTLISEITAANGKAIPIVADVAAPDAAQTILAKCETWLGPVDVLVNNAGISRIGPLAGEPQDLDIWWRVHEVNVRAPVALARAVLPSMLSRNTGTIISTSSEVAALALPVMTAYASSKAALSKFHESLSIELASTNILTFAVNPGRVKTELGAPENALNKAQIQHPAMQKFLAGVQGDDPTCDPELCADAMVALAADPGYRVLNGRHVNATQELPPVVEEARKEEKGRVGKERLYLVNIATL